MTEHLHTIPVDRLEVRAAPDGDGRTLVLRLLPWDTVADTSDGPELFRRGAFSGTDPGTVTVESMRHGGAVVGRGSILEERDDAPYLTARISRTHDGDDLLELVNDGTLRAASVTFAQPPRGSRRRADGVMERNRVDLRRVAILERGAYPGAGVVAVREAPEMPEATIEVTGPVVESPPAESPPTEAAARDQLAERMDRIDARLAAIANLGGRPAPETVHYRAQSLGELWMGAWREPELKSALSDALLYHRALVDQITTDNPGLMPAAKIRDAALIIERGRPAIEALGTDPLPDSGMTVNWPVMTTSLNGIVAKQTAEKAAVVSAKVSFGNASSAIGTFAGASDVSYQLRDRSTPAYLDQYARAMLSAWANVTDAQFVADMTAASTQNVVIGASATAAQIVTALVDASLLVETNTGQPATAVLAGSTLFSVIAKAFAGTSINPTSQGGTALAGTLQVNVSGLQVIHDRQLGATSGLVTNNIAAKWSEQGPNQVTVADAEKLGDNVAYWSYGVSAVYAPLGVIKITAT